MPLNPSNEAYWIRLRLNNITTSFLIMQYFWRIKICIISTWYIKCKPKVSYIFSLDILNEKVKIQYFLKQPKNFNFFFKKNLQWKGHKNFKPFDKYFAYCLVILAVFIFGREICVNINFCFSAVTFYLKCCNY